MDPSTFDTTTPAHEGKCPSCDGYLHPYASTCFGCGYERGSAFQDLAYQWSAITTLPLATLLESTYLAEWIARHHLDSPLLSEDERRLLIWRGNRGIDPGGEPPAWSLTNEPVTRYNYIGGLETHPHSEYGRMEYFNGQIRLIGERSKAVLAMIPLGRLLGLTAHATLDEVLGGRTFGLIGEHVAVFQRVEPTQGGALKFAFADDAGIWRIAVIGSRTGLTDKRFTFEYCNAVAGLIGLHARFWTTKDEVAAGGPRQYAEALGFSLPKSDYEADEAAGGEKACPECAEVIKAAARICRFCRYEFWPAT